MTDREFIEWAAREEARLGWIVGAKAMAEAFQRRQSEIQKAEAAFGAMQATRDRIQGEIARAQEQARLAGLKAQADLELTLRKRQAQGDAELEAGQATLARLKDEIKAADDARIAAKDALKAFRAEQAVEESALIDRINRLRTEEAALTDRLTAVLKR